MFIFFFFNDTATTEIYTLSLHDALPISTMLMAGMKINVIPNAAEAQVDIRRLPNETREEILARIRRIVQDPADRKSTRLNSSHSQISYAVFCLKKKKKIICRIE